MKAFIEAEAVLQADDEARKRGQKGRTFIVPVNDTCNKIETPHDRWSKALSRRNEAMRGVEYAIRSAR